MMDGTPMMYQNSFYSGIWNFLYLGTTIAVFVLLVLAIIYMIRKIQKEH